LKDVRPEQLHGKICSQFRCPSSSVVVETGASTSPAPAPCAAPFYASEEVGPPTVSSSSFVATRWTFWVLSLRIPAPWSSLGSCRLVLLFPGVTAVPSSALRCRLWLGPFFPYRMRASPTSTLERPSCRASLCDLFFVLYLTPLSCTVGNLLSGCGHFLPRSKIS
jgi:hypothetical protein